MRHIHKQHADCKCSPAGKLDGRLGVEGLHEVCGQEEPVVARALCDRVCANRGIGIGWAAQARAGIHGTRIGRKRPDGAQRALGGSLMRECAGAASLARDVRGGPQHIRRRARGTVDT